MTFEEWGDVLRIAATIWPHSPSFFEDLQGAERTPTRTWWAALCRFDTEDVRTAIGRLGMTSRFWPSLADVGAATRDALAERTDQQQKVELLGRARLAEPRQRTVEERLAIFDRTSAAVRKERRRELQLFVARAHGPDVDIRDSVDVLEGVGFWEHRLRSLIGRGWPGDSQNEYAQAP